MNRQSTETVYRVEPWVIRPARTMDAAALCAYFAIIAGERPNNTSIRRHSLTLSTAAMRERIEQTLQDNAGALFVAVQAGSVVGYVSLSRPNDAFRAHIATLSVNVHPEWRGCGLGSALLDSALAWARSQPQIERVELEALTRNKGAIRLYRRHGFRVEGVSETPIASSTRATARQGPALFIWRCRLKARQDRPHASRRSLARGMTSGTRPPAHEREKVTLI